MDKLQEEMNEILKLVFGAQEAFKIYDPQKMFEGTGKLMRHIKLYPDSIIPSAQIKNWIEQAIALQG